MAKAGIIFETDTGKTRKVAKQIYTMLGSDDVAKLINTNNYDIEELLVLDNLITGTPTLGEGEGITMMMYEW